MVPSQGVFYASYEIASTRLNGQGGAASATAAGEVLSGGIAGTCEWSSCLPADTVRARLYMEVLAEGKPAEPVACARRLLVDGGGWTAMYRGLAPALLRAFVANAAAFGGITGANHVMKACGL